MGTANYVYTRLSRQHRQGSAGCGVMLGGVVTRQGEAYLQTTSKQARSRADMNSFSEPVVDMG